MGFWSWLLNKPSKAQGKKLHRKQSGWGGSKRRASGVRDEMRRAGINPDLAYCTECGEWYNVMNSAAVDRHAH